MKLFLLLIISMLSLALYANQADNVRQNFAAGQEDAQEDFDKLQNEMDRKLSGYEELKDEYDRFQNIRAEQNQLQSRDDDQEDILANIQQYKSNGTFSLDSIAFSSSGDRINAKQAFKDTKKKVFTAIDNKVDSLKALENSEFLKKMQNPPAHWPAEMKAKAKANSNAVLAGIAHKKAKFKKFKNQWRWSPNLLTSNSEAAFKMKEFLHKFEGSGGPMYMMRQAEMVWDVASRGAENAMNTGLTQAVELEKSIEEKFGINGVGGTERERLLTQRVDNFSNAIKNSLLNGRHNKLEAKFILQDLDNWAAEMGVIAERAALKELLLNDKEFNKKMANTPLGIYVNGQIAKAAAMAKDDVCNQITQCTETNEKVFGDMFKFLDTSKRAGEADVSVDPTAVETRKVKED